MPASIVFTTEPGLKIPPATLHFLHRHLKAVLRLQKIHAGEWSIALVSDRTMKQLHHRHMNLPTTTDVLTFDLSVNREFSLETAVCVAEARRQAKSRNIPLKNELLLYALHSLLHVRGYDDLTPAQSIQMHRREDGILLTLGVGRVYQPDGPDAIPVSKGRPVKPRD